MINLTKIAKFSAKKMLKGIIEESKKNPFISKELKSEVKITKLFFQHIAYSFKKREYREIIERLLIIPFIKEIIINGTKIEERQEKNIISHKISKNFSQWTFSIIILEREQQKDFVLLSCFNEYKKKKTLS